MGIDLDQGGYSRAAPRRKSPWPSPPANMANIKSQKKRIARAERERLENRRYTSKIKTFFRRLERAVAEGDGVKADAEHRELVQAIDKAVKRGALHRNAGARKKSRAARLRDG
jgi:small subunit ribosomal protein S20